jgi:Protein of unknown function (DUF2853)
LWTGLSRLTLPLGPFRWVGDKGRCTQQRIIQEPVIMSKRDELIAKYADDLRKKCKMEPDMGLLTKVTIGCGPAIYNADSETVAASQTSELETIKANFLMKKLGLSDSPKLMEAINAVVETYGKSEKNKYRAVVYYMLVKHFGKEGVYA